MLPINIDSRGNICFQFNGFKYTRTKEMAVIEVANLKANICNKNFTLPFRSFWG